MYMHGRHLLLNHIYNIIGDFHFTQVRKGISLIYIIYNLTYTFNILYISEYIMQLYRNPISIQKRLSVFVQHTPISLTNAIWRQQQRC